MTVGIAAICEDKYIVGASDRMISSGDIQFEPQNPKILRLTNSILVQYAGDSGMARSVYYGALSRVKAQIDANPLRWLDVSDAALDWSRAYRSESIRQAEDALLSPLGLNLEAFLARQHHLEPGLVGRLSNSLQNFRSAAVSAIVSGIDESGPHIYVVRNSQVFCEDQIGFAAIGVGEWHASSQFMFAAHANQRPLPETLWLTYLAKKHAEVAPGVGSDTDMFAATGLGQMMTIGDHVLDQLEDTYKRHQRRSRQAAGRAEQKIAQFFARIIQPETPEQTTSPGELAPGPP